MTLWECLGNKLLAHPLMQKNRNAEVEAPHGIVGDVTGGTEEEMRGKDTV